VWFDDNVIHTEHAATLPPLVALKAISNGALSGASLPQRIKLLNWGRNESVKGPILVDAQSLAAMGVNQARLGYDRIALDYEHNTVDGSPEFARTREPRDVAGYGVPKIISGDGLYLEDITWTASGLANARNYADLSPTPALDHDGRVTFLHSVGLVRNGAVFGLSFFSAPQSTRTATSMTPEQIAAAIAAALKPLTDTLITLSADMEAIKEVKPPAFELKQGDKVVTLSAAEVLTRIITLEATVAAQASAASDAGKAALITRFAAEGKAPVDGDGKPMDNARLVTLSVDTLKLMLTNTPATVPLSARGGRPLMQTKDDKLTGLDRSIAANKQEHALRA